jgi:galactose mutarotase-like enzyme
MIRIYQKDGLTHLAIGNEQIEAVFLPQLGSKMISLRNKKTGTEFLLANQSEDKIYQHAYHGADFSEYDASGYDECFPTVEASELTVENNNGEKEISFPDHGELWSKEWDYEIQPNAILFFTEGVNAKYRIKKLIALKENRLVIDYSLLNMSDFPFYYIWSAHPLLAVEEGDRILLPENINKLFLNWASDDKIGTFGQYIHPSALLIDGSEEDIFKIHSKDLGIAIKGFTDPLNRGSAGLFRSRKDETLLVLFDNIKLPYLGIWLCYGGWPVDSERKHYTIALEPATGRPDSLSESVKRNECSLINIGEKKNWQVEFSLWEGIPEI